MNHHPKAKNNYELLHFDEKTYNRYINIEHYKTIDLNSHLNQEDL